MPEDREEVRAASRSDRSPAPPWVGRRPLQPRPRSPSHLSQGPARGGVGDDDSACRRRPEVPPRVWCRRDLRGTRPPRNARQRRRSREPSLPPSGVMSASQVGTQKKCTRRQRRSRIGQAGHQTVAARLHAVPEAVSRVGQTQRDARAVVWCAVHESELLDPRRSGDQSRGQVAQRSSSRAGDGLAGGGGRSVRSRMRAGASGMCGALDREDRGS